VEGTKDGVPCRFSVGTGGSSSGGKRLNLFAEALDAAHGQTGGEPQDARKQETRRERIGKTASFIDGEGQHRVEGG
jgi:hypothetical protein